MCNYGLGRYSRRLRMFCPGGSFYRSICRKRKMCIRDRYDSLKFIFSLVPVSYICTGNKKMTLYECQRKTVAFGSKKTFWFTFYLLCGRCGAVVLHTGVCASQAIHRCYIRRHGDVYKRQIFGNPIGLRVCTTSIISPFSANASIKAATGAKHP